MSGSCVEEVIQQPVIIVFDDGVLIVSISSEAEKDVQDMSRNRNSGPIRFVKFLLQHFLEIWLL